MINLEDVQLGAEFYNHTYEHICKMTVIKIEPGFIAYLAYMAGSCSRIDCLYLSATFENKTQRHAWHKTLSLAYLEKSKELKQQADSFARWSIKERSHEVDNAVL